MVTSKRDRASPTVGDPVLENVTVYFVVKTFFFSEQIFIINDRKSLIYYIMLVIDSIIFIAQFVSTFNSV